MNTFCESSGMPILGIDADNCVQCGQCVLDCPAMLFSKNESGSIEFADPFHFCIACGHCVAVCPTDAVLRERMDSVAEFPGVQAPQQLISYAPFMQFLQAKRSIRRYKKDLLPPDVLDKIFTAIRYAPAGTNMRNLRYVLMSDTTKIKSLGDAVGAVLTRDLVYGTIYGEIFKRKKTRGEDFIFCNAPHVIVAHSTDKSGIDAMNAGVSLTYGMLAAQTLGVGSCWCGFLQMAAVASKDIMDLIGIRGRLWGAILVGYPDVKYFRAPHRPLVKVFQS